MRYRLPHMLLCLSAVFATSDAWANRYYSPETGRFITRDPIGYRGGNNLYEYARSNATMRVDTVGLKSRFQECYDDCMMGPWEHTQGYPGKFGEAFQSSHCQSSCFSHLWVEVGPLEPFEVKKYVEKTYPYVHETYIKSICKEKKRRRLIALHTNCCLVATERRYEIVLEDGSSEAPSDGTKFKQYACICHTVCVSNPKRDCKEPEKRVAMGIEFKVQQDRFGRFFLPLDPEGAKRAQVQADSKCNVKCNAGGKRY